MQGLTCTARIKVRKSDATASKMLSIVFGIDCEFHSVSSAALAKHIGDCHSRDAILPLAEPQQPVASILPSLPTETEIPSWSLATPIVRAAPMHAQRNLQLGNWVCPRFSSLGQAKRRNETDSRVWLFAGAGKCLREGRSGRSSAHCQTGAWPAARGPSYGGGAAGDGAACARSGVGPQAAVQLGRWGTDAEAEGSTVLNSKVNMAARSSAVLRTRAGEVAVIRRFMFVCRGLITVELSIRTIATLWSAGGGPLRES